MRAKIIAVDFDGTLIEEGKWPDIGETNHKVLDYCKGEKVKGARIILWTNRTGEPLATAVRWCEDNGLQLDAVNANLPEVIEFFGTDTRKIYADEFIDDRMAKGFELPYTAESEEDKIPVSQVLDDMYNPNGGPASWAARDYYRQHYATEEELKIMDREDRRQTILSFIFMAIFFGLAVFSIIACLKGAG